MAVFSRRFRVESLESRRLLAAIAGDPFDQATHDSSYTEIRSSPHSNLAWGADRSAAQIDRPQISADIDDTHIDEIAVSIAAENLTGTRAVELRFEYANELLDVAPASLSLGDAWRGRASLVRKVDDVAGTISVFIYSTQPMTMSTGELLQFELDVSDSTALGEPEALLELVKFELNEGELHSSPTVSLQISQDDATEGLDGNEGRAYLDPNTQFALQESRTFPARVPRPAAEQPGDGAIAAERQSSLSWQRIVSGNSANNWAYPVHYVVHGLPTSQPRFDAPADLNSSHHNEWWQRWQASALERRRWGHDVDFHRFADQQPAREQPASVELSTVLHACLPWS